MECNKEEAIRAKELAEKKMSSKDFVGARKMVLKAQQLYPHLENISHMLPVCDVHCAAESKVQGSEPDWYGILQVEQTADEASIKKQYRKLALQLHPDKNKFPGAEAAFKLIGEAHRLLSDQTKRRTFDLKRSVSMRTAQPKQSQPQPNRSNYPKKQPEIHNNPVSTGTAQFTSMNPHQQKQQQQTQPVFANGQQTFWTACPFCNIRYQYYRNILNRALRCQSCMKPFIAHDLNTQGMASGANNRSSFQKKEGPSQDGPKMGPKSTYGNRSHVETVSQPFTKTGGDSVVGGAPKPKAKEDANVQIPREHKPSGNQNRKRRRNVESDEESSDSCDTESSTDIEENGDNLEGQDIGLSSGHNPRRSSRHKHNVSYKENLSDDDGLPSSLKRSKRSGSPDATKEQSEESMKGEASKLNEPFDCSADFGEDTVEKQKSKVPLEGSIPDENKKAESCKKNGKEVTADDDNNEEGPEVFNESESNPGVLEVADPDFFDFDRDKSEECFAVDQMWAIYDDVDGMPRFYARIKKVYSPGFKVQITWLEASPDDQDAIVWNRNRLPIACGKFKHEKNDITEDIGTFSHRILWEKGATRGTYKIYPRKGETWALFRNWNINWGSDPENHRNYEYEFVEVLSDFTMESGNWVAYLVKIKGFVSLFMPTKNDGTASFQIPPNELLRFSHRVPSFRTTGTEREDVPEGYFELDPASLPSNLEEISHSVYMKVESIDGKSNDSKSSVVEKHLSPKKSKNPDEQNTFVGGNSRCGNGSPRVSNGCYKKPSEENDGNLVEQISSGSDGVEVETKNVAEQSPSFPFMDPSEIPESEFYSFEDDKSHDKFQVGQIWVLYCELDGLPKYYALIKKVELSPEFKLNITWLEACPPPKGVIQWLDKKMPICCGMFTSGEQTEFDDTASFSHLSRGATAGKKNKFEIYPRKGEVWALYRNFSSKWLCTDLNKCEYDICEVVEDNAVTIKVFLLERVSDFETVFKVKRKAGCECFLEIPRVEWLIFSHQIPAFQLTYERDGQLRGCWELDPKALPVCFFSSK